MTLKNAISEILSHHCLDIQNICGQGYDGASNMRVLIAASKEVSSVYQFFQNLNFHINIINASSKRHDQLQAAQISEFERLQAIGELETRTGSNQEIMGITEILCQALQQKSQDILNAIQLVSSTKELIQELRDDGWKRILESVVNFSKLHEIDVPDLDTQYIEGRSRRHHDQITIEHHYHFDIFNSTIDFQLQELDGRFNERTMEILSLSYSLDPKNGYKAFNIDDICSLAEKYYLLDFSEQERIILNCQLKHFHKDIPKHSELQNLSSISELCQ
ncbi:uncharacterized protein LOC133283829 [Gastrolobium bilobum]|uniref:uncharacterized protein LOC133283829 n=1 Tax=Gastrolobium bilobum TaxID=150636 RepID=UPI002AB190A8|nr:uncharacterized protein LOC133283829 [Gastrolobium bilobum]